MQTLKLTKKYETYSEYKDSGVEWLGNIPSDWKLERLKYLSPLVIKKVTKENLYGTYIALENIESKTGKHIPSKENVEPESIVNTFKETDVLFGKLRPYLAKVFSPDFSGTAAGEFLVLRPKDQINKRYLFYRVLSQEFVDTVNDSTYGAQMPRASWGFIGNLRITLPSLKNQVDIVKYLDEKISFIDQIIEKKEKQIELLNERRTAVISDVITKGLDPKPELVKSGIEWIGEIPKSWRIKRLKDISSYCSRGGTPEYTENENSFKFINQSCIRDGFLDLDKIKFSETKSKKGLIKNGDILINSTGTGTLGRLSVFNENGIYFADTHVTIYRPDKADSLFIMYLIQDPAWQNYLYASSVTGSTNQIELSRNKFLEIPVIIPPLEEQKKIAEYLDKKITYFSKSVNKLEESIELLREFKSSLISSTVTGKIKI